MPDAAPFDPTQFIKDSLREARRKLLDFSKSNRLLSFKHPDRGTDFLRVVDELPDELFKRLLSGAMTVEGLPEPLSALSDETSAEFARVLAEIKQGLDFREREQLQADRATGPTGTIPVLERWARDRARVKLGKAPIMNGKAVDVIELARASGINPNLEVPCAGDTPGANAAHHDDKIQTFYPAAVTDRRLRKLFETYQSTLQEKGINVLFAAIGFLEWFEDAESSIPNHAPLLMVPLVVRRIGKAGKLRYSFNGEDAEVEINPTLREYVRQRHHIVSPRI